MKSSDRIAAMAFALVLSTGAALAAPIGEDEAKAVAMKLMDDLSTGNYTSADAVFDTRVRNALGEQGSAGLWQVVTSKVGPLKQCEQARIETQGNLRAFTFPCEFVSQKIDILVVVTAESKVGTLRLAPPALMTSPKSADAPAKDDAKKD
jgi:hypothetical protein